METAITKKHVGIGFIFLFAVFFINSILARIPIDFESIWWVIRLGVFNLLIIATVVYIAFSRKCQSSLPAKIGGAMYALYSFWFVMEHLAFHFSGEGIVRLPSMTYVHTLYFVLYMLAVLLFAWGSKLWLPSKIAYSASVLTNVFCYVMGTIVERSMWLNGDDYEAIESVRSMCDTALWVSFAFVLVSLVLTIVWMCSKSNNNGQTETYSTYNSELNEI